MGRKRWILILCAWTTVGLLFTVQEIAVAKVHGGHVSWVLVGVIELVYWNASAGYISTRKAPILAPSSFDSDALTRLAQDGGQCIR